MMITHEDFQLLLTDELQCAIRANRGRDPLEVALDKRIAHASLVASQVKYLQRAEQKLPSYAAAECILPPRAFEQASSEAVAATKELKGERLLDLTCGLGVDTLHFSKRFREVVALERDPLLAAITRENFRRLGVENVRLINASAEEYLAQCEEHFDWVYADPDRRSESGRKLVCLEDCSPDILSLRPQLKRVARGLCLKNSPLFDIDEAFRLFPQSCVKVLSLGGECKEVVIETPHERPTLIAQAVGLGTMEVPLDERDNRPSDEPFDPDAYGWMVIPDVALQKARLVCHHLRPHGYVASENGYAFCRERPEGVLGRLFAVERMEPYNPKALKRELKGLRVELLKHDFPYSLAQIRQQTGTGEGNDRRLAFTKIGGKCWTIHLK